jgi:hypothetical protein
MKVHIVLLFCLTILAVGAAASDPIYKKIEGEYKIAGRSILDPPENEPQNTHFKMYLRGTAARDLYRAMQVKPIRDQCLDDGSMTKIIGGTQCTYRMYSKSHECSLAIDIKRQRIENAIVC